MNRSVAARWCAAVVTMTSLVLSLTVGIVVAGASSVPAPHRVRASGTATSVLVKWAPVAGVAVKKYVVISRPLGRLCVTASTSCYVKGLRPGKFYTFRVAAKSSQGTSAWSPPSDRVRVDKVSTYFVNTVASAGARVSRYVTAFSDTTTKTKEQYDLAKISDAYALFSKSLIREAWPSAAKSDLSAFIATVHTLGIDTVNSLKAVSVSSQSQTYYVLTNETNLEVLNEAKVRSALALPQVIIPPIAQTPTAVALGTSETIHDFDGDALAVTVSQVVDPATPLSDSDQPSSGDRFVAVELTISNTSSQEIQDDANSATIVTGSDGETYSANFGLVSQCASFEEDIGFVDLKPGDSTTGCVVFQLPTSVTVQSISFSLEPGYLDTAEWSN
jgi:Fibronectin type III domain/Domain of unknown function (DUF4352)